MADATTKHDVNEKADNSNLAGQHELSSKVMDEILRNPINSNSGHQIDADHSLPSLDVHESHAYPNLNDWNLDSKADHSDRPIYIPSPSDIAPAELPRFFENYPKSPELDKVGAAADQLAKLMNEKASPEEQQKAWKAFEDSAKGVPGNLAALRLEESFYNQKVPGGLGVEFNSYNGKLSVVDYGQYNSLGKFDYKQPDLKSLDINAGDKPEVLKASADFAERLQKGVTSDELKQLMPDLLNKLSAAGLDSSAASSAIYYALTHAPNSKYGNSQDVEPTYTVDGKPVHIWPSATMLDTSVTMGFLPERQVLFN